MPGYEVSPSFDELSTWSDERLRAVPDFTVKPKGIGQFKFLAPVDLLAVSPTGDVNGLRRIPGTVIVFEPRKVTVYPDDTKKDRVGKGVYQPAEIMLEKYWPTVKATKEPIRDVEDPRLHAHYRRLETMKGTSYMGYHPESGVWKLGISPTPPTLDNDEFVITKCGDSGTD